jgi:hypothetical protein
MARSLRQEDYDFNKGWACINCGAGFGDCACYIKHAPFNNDVEDGLIEWIDATWDKITLNQMADTIIQTNKIMKVLPWVDN